MSTPSVVERLPSVHDYQRLRRAVGWSEIDDDAAARGLARSLAAFCLVDGDEVMGVARVVGDGAVYFYIQDVIVEERLRGRGHGRALMDAVMAFIAREATPGAFVGLMAARDAAGFYERYWFEPRGDDRPGMDMTWD
ncbi:MAG: GNAT family N-acetyltransferase [Actinomycetota bacterium]